MKIIPPLFYCVTGKRSQGDFLLEDHLGKTLVKGCQILFAVAAEKLDVTQGLGILFLNGKAAVGILHIMSRGDDVIGDFKKILFIAAIRTF